MANTLQVMPQRLSQPVPTPAKQGRPMFMQTQQHNENSLQTQLVLFQEQQFTGRIDITVADGTQWSIYLALGRFAWVAGGKHPTRRWRRQLLRNNLLSAAKSVQMRETDAFECWDYQVLTLLTKRRLATTEVVVSMIRGMVNEVMFEILQATQLAALGTIVHDANLTAETPELFQLVPRLGVRPSTSDTAILPRTWTLEMTATLKMAQQAWENWSQAGLALCSPNLAPAIKQHDLLKQKTSAKLYQSLSDLVNGKRTLSDLAVLLKKDSLNVTRSLLPYIRQGLMGFTEIPDLPTPKVTSTTNTPSPDSSQSSEPTTVSSEPHPQPKGTILCIDDSPQIGEILEDLLQGAGYQAFWVADAIQAIPALLKHKPDMVFLDLMMPIANGYEICSQIRRVPQFKDLPVVILTSNDGLVDRVRAKMVGATDFLSKPIEQNKILSMLTKHTATV